MIRSSHESDARPRADLPRVLGAGEAMAIVVGTIIGSGIFLIPSEMMRDTGSSSLVYLAWIVGGCAVAFWSHDLRGIGRHAALCGRRICLSARRLWRHHGLPLYVDLVCGGQAGIDRGCRDRACANASVLSRFSHFSAIHSRACRFRCSGRRHSPLRSRGSSRD